MKIPTLAALAATIALSCSPADVAGTSGVSSAVLEACSDYSYAWCTKLSGCSSTFLQQRYGSATSCEAIEKASCVNALTAPQTGASVATRQACMAALPEWDCTDFIDTQNPPPACHTATGPLTPGEVCSVATQCQSGFCALPWGSACGTCAPVPPAGASCAETECPVGLVCLGTPPTCILQGGMGDSCLTVSYCIDGLACVGADSATSTPGTCQPSPATLGATCTFGGAGCDYTAGLACNAVSNTCVTLKLYQPGQACGEVMDQASACVGGTCPRGTCVASGVLGGACDIDGTACISGTVCIVSTDGGTSGTCQPRGSAACQ
jgi:hypothetical protein